MIRPLLPHQKNVWILCHDKDLNIAHNLLLTYHLDKRINIDIFKKSIEVIFKQQPVLASTVKIISDVPHFVTSDFELQFPVIDLTRLSPEKAEEAVQKFIRTESRIPFSLEIGPLFRFFLLSLPDETFIFHTTIHHLIFDGWSRKLFIRDLGNMYDAIMHQERTVEKLELLEIMNQEHRDEPEISTEQLFHAEEFWREYFLGYSPGHILSHFESKNKKTDYTGKRQEFVLGRKTSELLLELSIKSEISIFSVLFSIFGIALYKLSGLNDFCITVPLSTRHNRPELENTYGLYVDNSLLRIKIDEDVRLVDFLKETRKSAVNAFHHSLVPLPKVILEILPSFQSSLTGISDVTFSWVNEMYSSLYLDGMACKRIVPVEGVSPNNLTLYMWMEGEVLHGEIEYKSGYMEEDIIVRLKHSFIHLLEQISVSAERTIAEYSILSPEDVNILLAFNSTGKELPPYFAHTFFEQQVKNNPGKTAIIFKENKTTYQELDTYSNRIARFLLQQKIQPGDIIGIFLERSVEMIAAVYASLKCGCCYLPLDPSYPDHRIKYMLDDSSVKLVLTEDSLLEKLIRIAGDGIMPIDCKNSDLTHCSGESIPVPVNKNPPAYLIYTSGSTGKPKGVQINHKSVVNLINSFSTKPGISPNDILLAVVTLSFDMSVFELLLPLSFGGTLVLADKYEVLDGKKLIDLIHRHQVNLIQAAPTLFRLLLWAGWKGKQDLRALCGGEEINPSLVNQLLPLIQELWNCYGPTETTVFSTCYKFRDLRSPVMIGKPIDNTQIYILDKNNQILPPGIYGEIAIGGMGLARGYFNRPVESAEKFIKLSNGILVYKTGDWGKIDPDQNLVLSGRIDHQIKMRGYRIEPGEIENTLVQMEGIQEAVVKLHPFANHDERIVAFLMAEPSFKLNPAEISGALSQVLPNYMLPSHYQKCDFFPRTPNGKTDRSALVFTLQPVEEKKIDLNFTPSGTELILLQIWQSVLKTKEIEITDNFFNIGGNSLMALSVITEIEKTFKLEIGIQLFFYKPVIKDLAETIELELSKKSKKQKEVKDEKDETTFISGEI